MTKDKELHVNKGGMQSMSNKRISLIYFPVYDEGELIGNLTGDDLEQVLNASGFEIVHAVQDNSKKVPY